MTATRSTTTHRPTVEELIEQVRSYRPDPEQIRRDQLALEERIRGYELKFGLPSSEVHAAIERRELRETLDVCNWLMDYHSLVGKTAEDFR